MMQGVTVLLILSLVAFSVAQPANQKITSLPGLSDPINFAQYSGYVNVDSAGNRTLFYWFVESQNNPSTDPLFLWLNGGPGCSSLTGLLVEHGPFRVYPDGKSLYLNPYAWNKFANIIYLEAPAGVGFSYTDDPAYRETNDTRTAHDNFVFLTEWFKLFPSFQSNDFYFTGESYGGHYVPELALLTLKEIQAKKVNWNVKGVAVGNPGTVNDWYYNEDEFAFVSFMYSHGLIPQQAYSECVKACNWNDFLTECAYSYEKPSPACVNATTKATGYLPKDIDPYDVFAPTCNPFDGGANTTSLSHKKYTGMTLPKRFERIYGPSAIAFNPCEQNYMTDYLNIPAVQTAIHATRPTIWRQCGGVYYPNETANIFPIWEQLINQTNWKLLVYSGDADSAVAFLGTQKWIYCLHRPIKQDWSNWYSNLQTSGSYIVYDRITFLTLKGCGHMVPYYCPENGFKFMNRWIQGEFQ